VLRRASDASSCHSTDQSHRECVINKKRSLIQLVVMAQELEYELVAQEERAAIDSMSRCCKLKKSVVEVWRIKETYL